MSTVIGRQADGFLYQQVIQLIQTMTEQGSLQPGDKLPSLRTLATKLEISIPTVKQAYQALESQGQIVAREKSGYFLAMSATRPSQPKKAKLVNRPIQVNKQALIEQVYQAIHAPDMVPLGIANPVAVASTDKCLAKLMRKAMQQAGDQAINYGAMDGYAPLKKQIVHRYLAMGLLVPQEELVITNGAQEALAIALQCVTKPGDVVAIETPCYFGIVELVENLGLKAIEIPLCPEGGIWLTDLEQALVKHPIKACLFSTCINNPLGSKMDDEKRKQVVELLDTHQVTLIEDDVYGDLHFGEERAVPALKFAKPERVITCASFSKTAAPSYRIGWLIAGPFAEKARRIKRALSCSSSLMNQWVLADYLASGDYERHLKLLRQRLISNKHKMRQAVQRYFPADVRVSDPQGGCVLWLDLGKHYDGNRLFHLALEHGISLTPGSLFSAAQKYQNCVRLSFGLPWTDAVENAVKILGKLTLQAKKYQ
ncbi:Transcriptional regulator, GntR family domain / Aspartate aminotransferase [Pseudoalteromonas luteoviolacea B = ATCC 29581]|nr:Transcriptional regulator, GntR family domain / Aspartate aminotransferase [Pseudoalteromonas luteoviolacea B = ATCC 29581]